MIYSKQFMFPSNYNLASKLMRQLLLFPTGSKEFSAKKLPSTTSGNPDADYVDSGKKEKLKPIKKKSSRMLEQNGPQNQHQQNPNHLLRKTSQQRAKTSSMAPNSEQSLPNYSESLTNIHITADRFSFSGGCIDNLTRIFRMFNKDRISFWELCLGLRYLGIEVDSKDNQTRISTIVAELGHEQNFIGVEEFIEIGSNLIKEQELKPDSDMNLMQKSYVYMIDQGNELKSLLDVEAAKKNGQEASFEAIKEQIRQLPDQKKCLSAESLLNLKRHLNLPDHYLSRGDIEDIVRYLDPEEKGFLTFEDFSRAVNSNSKTKST